MEVISDYFSKAFKVNLSPDSFVPLSIDNCNAQGAWSFSNASVSVRAIDVGTIPDVFVFRGVLDDLVDVTKGRTSSLTSQQKAAVQCLNNFLKNEKHLACLEAMRDQTNCTKAELQSLLAAHLFDPLVPNSKVLTDVKSYTGSKIAECPICHCKVDSGNTSFGHQNLWHGHADILVEKSQVKIEGNEQNEIAGDDEEANVDTEIDEGSGEPASKRLKSSDNESASSEDEFYNECTAVVTSRYMPLGPLYICSKQNYVHRHNPTLSQILSQTIVNAFLQVKKNQHLEKYFISCILASNKHITIHMYNCSSDILLTQDRAMEMWNGRSLNRKTILTLWMALNFDKFHRCFPDENEEDKIDKHCYKSNFPKHAGHSFEIYKEELESPITGLTDMGSVDIARIDLDMNEFVRRRIGGKM